VCLVEKRNGRLGFPKGRAESSDASALKTAQREWLEETVLQTEGLSGLAQERVFVDGWGCHYFFAEWTDDLQGGTEPRIVTSWEVEDDPLDNDPIVRAYWMPYQEALNHHMLSQERKQILRLALQGGMTRNGSSVGVDAALEQGKQSNRRWRGL
jgi:8-oxo-dGTP pyrophosphatase MutT (NUDIX family)